MNDYQKTRFSRRVVQKLFNSVADKRIAVLGFAFKKDTNDTRESAAIYICRDLLDENANLAIYDPKVSRDTICSDLQVDSVLHREEQIEICRGAYDAAAGADALLILTEWEAFQVLDFEKIYGTMRKPAFVFDGRNLLDLTQLRRIGFEAYGIGTA